MGWATLIASIIGILGPILTDLLKKWLTGLLNRTAKSLGDPGDAGPAHADLLRAALDATPRSRVFKRAFLRHAITTVPEALAAGKLAAADRKELAALAAAAAGE